MLADQLLHRLEYIQSKDVIHRDVKPDNFLMDIERSGNKVYVTDMGLVTERRDIERKTNNADVTKRHLIGTARFASINGHLGSCECLFLVDFIQILNIIPAQSLRDDLEFFGYMLLYFLKDFFPWQDLKIIDQTQKDEFILKMKKEINTQSLCKDLFKKFGIYFNHVRFLDFDEISAYVYLHKIFCNLFVREGYVHDHVFDWTISLYLMSIQWRKTT